MTNTRKALLFVLGAATLLTTSAALAANTAPAKQVAATAPQAAADKDLVKFSADGLPPSRTCR